MFQSSTPTLELLSTFELKQVFVSVSMSCSLSVYMLVLLSFSPLMALRMLVKHTDTTSQKLNKKHGDLTSISLVFLNETSGLDWLID